MCWNCHCIGIFQDTADGIEIRKPTQEELEEIVQNAEVQRAMQGLSTAQTPLDIQRGFTGG
jgi:hypothetical protein